MDFVVVVSLKRLCRVSAYVQVGNSRLGIVAVHFKAAMEEARRKQQNTGSTGYLQAAHASHPPGGPAPRDGGLHVTALGIDKTGIIYRELEVGG